MHNSMKEAIYLQREQLGKALHEPLARLAAQCISCWPDRCGLNEVLTNHVDEIPHCSNLYCLTTDGIQICDNVTTVGCEQDHFGFDRSLRPYMNEVVPAWGFLLSNAYISLNKHRPSLTALQVVRSGEQVLGYLGADFDLRNLPVTSVHYTEPDEWRQIKGDPSIRDMVFQQHRVESPLDRMLGQAFAMLEELLTQRGVYQCHIHFASSQAIIWTVDDPFRYRILDHEAFGEPDVCLVYPVIPYPEQAAMSEHDVAPVLDILRELRTADENIYLRMSSINIFNGMVSLTFSCDGTHYMRFDELLTKDTSFWLGTAA
ncbi:MAG TPA: hypothetical protein VGE00_07665 [Gammaproteobacteria bacterium]